jgi:hypothetical protein
MRTRIALFVILAVGIISVAQLSSLLVSTSPYGATSSELWLFFISLFFCVTVLVGLVLYGFRYLRQRRLVKPLLWPSFRQSALASLVITLSLFFNTLAIFQIWNIIPLIIAAVLIEFFFQADKKPHATLTYDSES